MYDIIFYVFAAVTLISGVVVAVSRNIAWSAFALMFTFFGVSGLYVMLGADFVGVSQLLIYVGGILVLFLFGMMLTSNIDRLKEDVPTGARLYPAFFVSVFMAFLLGWMAWLNPAWVDATPKEIPAGTDTTSIIGYLLMGDFSLLFVASSIAILVALVGAAMIARSDRLTPEEAAERM